MKNLAAPTLTCKTCNKAKAPESVTSKLLTGDVFVEYTCEGCSPTGAPTLKRAAMNWVSIVHLVLFHLHSTSSSSDKKAYFRWKEDICRLIEENWSSLCAGRNAAAAWINSISSILSANSHIFESGFTALGQSGWWGLKNPEVGPELSAASSVRGRKRAAPAVMSSEADTEDEKEAVPMSDEPVEVVEPESPKRRRASPRKAAVESPVKLEKPAAPKSPAKPISTTVPVSASTPSKSTLIIPTPSNAATAPVDKPVAMPPALHPILPAPPHPSPQVPNFPAPAPPSNNLVRPPVPAAPPHPTQQTAAAQQAPPKPPVPIPRPTSTTTAATPLTAAASLSAADEIKRKLVERLLRVDSNLLKQALTQDPKSAPASAQQQQQKKEQQALQSTIKKKATKPAHYIRASPHENELAELVSRVANPDDQVNRLKRKLAVRKAKRMCGTQLFDLDNWIYLYLKAGNEPIRILPASAPHLLKSLEQMTTASHVAEEGGDASLLHGTAADALVQAELNDVPFLKDPQLSFRAKLEGVTHLEGWPFPLESPYTGKMLPTVVHRETIKLPARCQLLRQIRTHSQDQQRINEEEGSIDFMHLRKEFVPQVNALLRAHFWPSIDISESLEAPDYTLVLVYRKRLVIGTAICSPDGYLSYLLVRPEWRGARLGERMLYLLVGRLLPPGKDVTVHVAAGNPAMIMYQRFGFKPEEFIVDFYGARYRNPTDDCNRPDPASRNAFFLRLRR